VPYLSTSAVVIHYEEALYQVYAPLPLQRVVSQLFCVDQPHRRITPDLPFRSVNTRLIYLEQSADLQGSSRMGTHENAIPVLFLYNGNVIPVVFFCILQLLTVILSSLIFISLVGPLLTQFNPLPYVKKWLAAWHMVIGVPMTISQESMQESVTQRKNHATAI